MKHPTFGRNNKRVFLICFILSVISVGIVMLSARGVIDTPFPTWFMKLTFLGSIFVMISYPVYDRLTVSCPICKTRLEWIDSGNGGLRNATAKCPNCNEVYDLGMSFSD